MGNCILAFPDKSLAGSFTGGSWNNSYFPLSNIGLSPIALKARSTDALAASTQFNVDLGASLKLRVLAIVGHNLSIAATIRVRFSTVADFSSNVYDSGAISAYPNYYDDMSLDWGQPVLTANKPSTADAIAMRYPLFFVTPAIATAQYARVEITDTANPAGYVEISRCFIAPGLTPDENMKFGTAWGLDARTKTSEALNGTPYFNRVNARRKVNFTIGGIGREAGTGHYLEMQRVLDLDKELFFVSDPDATSMSLRLESFMGRLRQLADYEYVSFQRGDMGFQILESV
jgi:hypothetical protein